MKYFEFEDDDCDSFQKIRKKNKNPDKVIDKKSKFNISKNRDYDKKRRDLEIR